MNTTPGTEDNPDPTAAAGAEATDRLEALAALDPADAPDAAEAVAADLVRDLEAVSADGSSQSERHDGEDRS